MVSDNNEECPVCKMSEDLKTSRTKGKKVYTCQRCGIFSISDVAILQEQWKEKSTELSGWLRERHERGIEIQTLTPSNLPHILAELPQHTPLEKQLKLLESIELKTHYPGHKVYINYEFDISLAWAKNKEEFVFYLKALLERGLIGDNESTSNTSSQNSLNMLDYALGIKPFITAKGWEYLEAKASNNTDKVQVFVAMSFDNELNSVYENVIKKAINSTGYRACRADSEPDLGRIDEKIIVEIKKSRFVVADLTQQNSGVYFEAGFAMALGLPVILCVNKDDLKNVHFDVRQFNCILWEKNEEDDFKNQLETSILYNIGRRN